MERTGTTDLPLHGGKAPRWLFERMVRLSRAITETIITEYGEGEFVKRITDPHWFQALSCTIGFDWHSSGTTTTTCGALKEGLDPEKHGIAILGGKGRVSRKTPNEIRELEGKFSMKPSRIDDLVDISKLSAKIDNSCIQDNYQLYHHCLVVSESDDWGVIQQGMNEKDGYARRYQWYSGNIEEMIEEPHKGISCDKKEEEVLNLTDSESHETRKISLDLINDNPDHIRKYLDKNGQTVLTDFSEKKLKMTSKHAVLDLDLSERSWKVLKKAYEIQPGNYKELISLKGMGPKKIRALALVSDLIYGSDASWEDPVKYSFAHGGKDGTPFPVEKGTYDNTIRVLEKDLERAELAEKDKKYAFKRLKKHIDV